MLQKRIASRNAFSSSRTGIYSRETVTAEDAFENFSLHFFSFFHAAFFPRKEDGEDISFKSRGIRSRCETLTRKLVASSPTSQQSYQTRCEPSD